MELSRQQPYYTWFTRVVVPSGNHPEIVGDDERLNAAFERRVRRSIALHDAFDSSGYDTRRPIILRTGHRDRAHARPESDWLGRSMRATAAIGLHGCGWRGSRCSSPACTGCTSRRSTDRATRRRFCSMRWRSARHDYFSFLSLSYADRELSSEEALLDHVRSTDPDRLPEIREVLAVDSPRLAAAVHSDS